MAAAHVQGADQRAATAGVSAPFGAAAELRWLLPVLTVVAAGAVQVWGLSRGNVHYYYSAAVRSMSGSWSNLCFGALDPAGSITLDKLPGAFWAQALLVRVFGFHPWVLLMPGTVATAATVPMLYLAVRRWAGWAAGSVAALLLLVSPVTFAAARVNLADPVLVFLLVAAGYAMTRAIDGRSRWLVVAAVLIGAAFQVKMVQAWLVVPALVAAYAIGAAASPRAKALYLAGFLTVTAVLSLSWVVAVGLIPPAKRPYIDGSTANSPWQMVFSYNGLRRAGAGQDAVALPFAGSAGPLRLLNDQYGAQIGWTIPFAVIVAGAGGALACRTGIPARAAGWVLWAGWLLTAGASISAANDGHPYYATMIAPALAALGGGGLTALTTASIRPGLCRVASLSALAVSAGWNTALILRAPAAAWTTPLLVTTLVLALISVVAVLTRRSATIVAVLAVFAVSVGPAWWIVVSPAIPPSSVLTANPVAGPPSTLAVFGTESPSSGLTMMFGTPPGSPPPSAATPMLATSPDHHLVAYLQRQRGSAEYLFAASDASSASTYLAAGLSVLPMGGFTAAMPYPTIPQLRQLLDHGQLRFVWLTPMPGIGGPAGDRQSWVTDHCTPVHPRDYTAAPSYAVLYDCAPKP